MQVNPAIVSSLLTYTSNRPSPMQQTPTQRSPFGASTAYGADDAAYAGNPAGGSYDGFVDTMLRDVLNQLLELLTNNLNGGKPAPAAPVPAPAYATETPIPTSFAPDKPMNQTLVNQYIAEQQRQSRVLYGGTVNNSVTDAVNDRLNLNGNYLPTVFPTSKPPVTVVEVEEPDKTPVVFSSSKDKARVWGDPHYVTFQNQKFDYHGIKAEKGELVSYMDTANVSMAAEFKPWGGGNATVNGRVFTLIEDIDGTVHEVVIDPSTKKVTINGQELKEGEQKDFVLADVRSKDGAPVQGFIKADKNKALFNLGQVDGNIEYAGGGKGTYSNLNFNVTTMENTYEVNGIVGDQLDADYVNYQKGHYFHDKNGDGKVQEDAGELTNLDSYVIDRADEKATKNEDYFAALSTFTNGDGSLFNKDVNYTTLGVGPGAKAASEEAKAAKTKADAEAAKAKADKAKAEADAKAQAAKAEAQKAKIEAAADNIVAGA